MTVLNVVLARAFSSTALLATRYFSRKAIGDLKVQPASAALTKTKVVGEVSSETSLPDKQSIATKAKVANYGTVSRESIQNVD